jgi:acetyl esterase/lipase
MNDKGSPLALIIEDDEDLASIFSQAIEGTGFKRGQIEIFHDGLEAWKRMVSVTPDFVYLDLMLPGMHGTDILDRMKSDPRFERTTIVVVTAHDELARSVIGKADKVLIKPIGFRDLARQAVRSFARVPTLLLRKYISQTSAHNDKISILAIRNKLEQDAKNVVFVPSRAVILPSEQPPGEWIMPKNQAPSRVILWLHGGDYYAGSPQTHRGLVAQIALASQARGFTLDYRLAPEHPFPAALDDAIGAYRWMIEENKIPHEQICIGGDSAGGGLAIATALRLQEEGIPLPAALVCISPWADLTCSGASMKSLARIDPWLTPGELRTAASLYCDPDQLTNPLVSPALAPDLAGLPSTLIHVGSDEILLDDSMRLAERLRAAGVQTTLETWAEMWHVFHAFAPWERDATRAIKKIGEFVIEKTGDVVS